MTPKGGRGPARRVEMVVDGACSRRGGAGGWAAVLTRDGESWTLSGGEDHTNDNRMNLTATVEGLASLEIPSDVVIHTDSRYVCEGVLRRMPGWIAMEWRNAEGKPVRNLDLWHRLAQQVARHEITWTWCNAHPGPPLHEVTEPAAGLAMPDHVIRTHTERKFA